MIGVTDAGNILYRDCKRFGLEVKQSYNVPNGVAERIVINTNAQLRETYFKKGWVNVNFVVPNLKSGNANLIRLEEVEEMAKTLEGNGWYKDSYYRYSPYSIELIKDEIDAHFINCRVLFEVLNVK